MVVAVPPMGMVEAASDEVVSMVAMRNGLVSARRIVETSSGVRSALKIRSANIRVVFTDCNFVLIHMIAVHAVQMTIVEIIGVAIVFNGLVAAARPVDVCVGFVDGVFARHSLSFFITGMPFAAGACRKIEH